MNISVSNSSDLNIYILVSLLFVSLPAAVAFT